VLTLHAEAAARAPALVTSLLPSLEHPRIVRLGSRAAVRRAAGTLDAIVAIVREDAGERVFDELPEPGRWRDLRRRSPVRAGDVRASTLANGRQTLAVVGFLRSNANAFETATLAGRVLKELAARRPAAIGVFAPGGGTQAALVLDALLQAALAHAFAMPSFRTSPQRKERLRSIAVPSQGELDVRYAAAASRGNNLARWLTALPPNKLDAPAYRRMIATLARERGIGMRWLDERALRRLGANAFLAVSAGNAQRTAGIAHLRYRPRARRSSRAPAVALVGKGILFDTGGTNLKPHRAMLDMHTDMAGSAVALAALCALAELRAPFAADAWLAITENRIGPQAYRPQDIVQAANGVTIQVVHTDAEGRMVLADTLALAGRTQPRLLLDFATLTGAAVYALTERMSAFFTNRPALEEPLAAAGRASGERVWGFPLDADYDSDIESKVADVAQCALEGKGDHILAARFLSRFVPKEVAWAHLDLAAAVRSGGLGHIGTDVTGFGVRYTLELLLRQKVLGSLGAKA
jgi:leucyl aminopeptidase